MLGPTGVGVLYGKTEILEDMDPYQTGGGMIRDVTMEKSSWSCLPHKFEAGSPPSAQVYGMGAAIDFLNLYPSEYENVFQYALEKMYKVDGITIYGNAPERTSTISFNIDNIASLDIAQLLDYEGIAIRSGHHCCQPLMKSLNISSCARISFYVYNTIEEVDIFIEKLNETIKKLS